MCCFTCSNNSIKELEAFAESANAVNRMVLTHMSITEAFKPPNFNIGESPWEEDDSTTTTSTNSRLVLNKSASGDAIFAVDDLSVVDEANSSEEEPDEAPILWMGLTPPGTSGLARRRLEKLSSGDSSDGDKENMSPPSKEP